MSGYKKVMSVAMLLLLFINCNVLCISVYGSNDVRLGASSQGNDVRPYVRLGAQSVSGQRPCMNFYFSPYKNY